MSAERLESMGIDSQQVMQRFLGKTDFLARMLKAFEAEDAPKKLQDALESGSMKEVEHVARTIRGSAANLGFTDLNKVSMALIKAARAEDSAQVEDLGAQVLEETKKAYAAIAVLPEVYW